jgi:predicted amidohydrolase
VALANSQWWVQSNQCGAHATTTLLGASRIVAPTGTVVAEATRAVPGVTHSPELLVQRIDLHLAYQRDGVGTLLEEGRRPDLYVDG